MVIKKLTSLIMVLTMLFSVFVVTSGAEEEKSLPAVSQFPVSSDGSVWDTEYPANYPDDETEKYEYGDYEYFINDDDTVTITKYNGNSEYVVIPETLGVRSVSVLGKFAFSGAEFVKSVTIPKTVYYIPASCFLCIPNLEEIIAPEDSRYYTSINGVLYNKQLTSIIRCPQTVSGDYQIPDGVTRISQYAFCGCKLIKRIRLPETVNTINFGAFFGCSDLSEINMPASIDYIGQFAFCQCSSLQVMRIPDNVQEIESGTFGSCSSLKELTLPSNLETIYSYAFAGCTSLENVIIPPKTVSVGKEVFADCGALKSIIIPSSLTFIEEDTFYTYREFAAYIYMIENGIVSIFTSAWECGEKIFNFTIYGVPGSYAEQYAKEHGFKFEIMGGKNSITDREHGMRFYSTIKNNTIYIDELELLSANYFGGSINGYYTGNKKVEWEFENPDLFEIVHSSDDLTSITLMGKTPGTSKITLKIDGKEMVSDMFKVEYSKKWINNKCKEEILASPHKQLLDRGLESCKNIMGTFSSNDRLMMSFIKAATQGDQVVYQSWMSAFGVTESLEDEIIDGIILDYMSQYYELGFTPREFTENASELYDYFSDVLSALQTGRSLNEDSVIRETARRSSLTVEESRKVFNKAQRSMTFVSYAGDSSVALMKIYATVITMNEFDINTIDKLIWALGKTPPGNGSVLYEGLCRLRDNMTDPDYIIDKFINERTYDTLNLIASSTLSPHPAFEVFDMYFALARIGNSIYEENGGATADGYLEALNSYSCAYTLHYVLENMSPNDHVECVYNFYTAATITGLEKCIDFSEKHTGVSSDNQIQQRAKYRKEAELIYNQIIQSKESYTKNIEYIKGLNDLSRYSSENGTNTFENKQEVYACYDYADKNSIRSSTQPSEITDSIDEPFYINEDEMILIPAEIENSIVVGIADEGYKVIKGKKEIILPETVRTIGNSAFAECSDTLMILLGNKLEYIGENAFGECASLKYINIPDSVLEIGVGAFQNCTSLEQIDVNAETISSRAFANCSSLNSITINNRYASIAEDAFENANKDLVIIGYNNSTASEYAQLHGIKFSAIEQFVENMTIISTPNKYVYNIGESINTDGLTINVEYTDGTSEVISDGWTVSCDTSSSGDKQAYVYYMDQYLYYPIFVNEQKNETAYSLDIEECTMLEGTKTKLSIIDNDTHTDIQWVSESPDIAFVSDNGDVYAVGSGETTIKAIIPNSETVPQCKVTVVNSSSIDMSDKGQEHITFTPLYDSFYMLNTDNSLVNMEIYSSNGLISTNKDSDLNAVVFPMYAGNTYLAVFSCEEYDNTKVYVNKINIPVSLLEGESETKDTPSPDKQTDVLGDIDGDGKISAKDSLLVQRYVIKLKELDENQLKSADVNADGKVTNKDALSILRYTIGYKVEGL